MALSPEQQVQLDEITSVISTLKTDLGQLSALITKRAEAFKERLAALQEARTQLESEETTETVEEEQMAVLNDTIDQMEMSASTSDADILNGLNVVNANLAELSNKVNAIGAGKPVEVVETPPPALEKPPAPETPTS